MAAGLGQLGDSIGGVRRLQSSSRDATPPLGEDKTVCEDTEPFSRRPAMSSMTTTELRAASRARSALDYPGTIRAHYPYWDAQYRPYLLLALDALPAEHFHFKPKPDMLTAHQIVLHVAEAEVAWMTNVVEGKPFEEWVVEHEDKAQGWKTTKYQDSNHAALRDLLENCHRHTQAWFDRPVSELGRVITYTPKGLAERQYKLHWILDHLQEHEIHHRSQLNTYLRMLGITPPSI